MMPTDYKKEWMEKSSIDYFSPFVSLWLACNSWYMSHYSDLNDNHAGNRTASDRDFINKLKEDISGRNHLYSKYLENVEKTGKDGIHWSLDWIWLHPFARNKGISSQHWAHFEQMFGNGFLVQPPHSPAMKAFLEKRKHIKNGSN